MGKWNDEAAPNNNLHATEIKSSKLIQKSKSQTKGLINQDKKKML